VSRCCPGCGRRPAGHPETITTLLATIDGVRSLLAADRADGNEGDVDVDSIITPVHAR
jgi:two-component system chemotaxis sensor kinase CheA